jgi:DNA-binding HxlR family transcriptional regulator
MSKKTLRTPGDDGKPVRVQADPWAAKCPSRDLIELLSSKWVLLLIPLLRDNTHRNGELMRKIGGISQKMLTQTLRRLEQRRLIIRRVHKEVPPHVEYELSPLGRSLAKTIATLDEWVVRNYHRTLDDEPTPGSRPVIRKRGAVK